MEEKEHTVKINDVIWSKIQRSLKSNQQFNSADELANTAISKYFEDKRKNAQLVANLVEWKGTVRYVPVNLGKEVERKARGMTFTPQEVLDVLEKVMVLVDEHIAEGNKPLDMDYIAGKYPLFYQIYSKKILAKRNSNLASFKRYINEGIHYIKRCKKQAAFLYFVQIDESDDVFRFQGIMCPVDPEGFEYLLHTVKRTPPTIRFNEKTLLVSSDLHNRILAFLSDTELNSAAEYEKEQNRKNKRKN